MQRQTQEPSIGSEKNNRGITTFSALRYTSFRYLWLGHLGHAAAMWMEQVVRPLLILELTGSALQVGLVIFLRTIPQLIFGLLAGVIADRYDKRRILMFSQIVTMLMHLALAILIISGHLAIWHIFVTAFVSGASMAFNQPARQSMIPRLVPRQILLNALSLTIAAGNVMRVLGASLAGLLLIFFDFGEVYLLNVLLLVGVIYTTMKIKLVKPVTETLSEVQSGKQTTLLRDFKEGFHYIARNPVLLYLVAMGLLLFIFAAPYQQVFAPLLALDVLDIGRSGAGWLLAFSGIGAMIGSLSVASMKRLYRRGLIMMAFLLAMGASLVLLAQSQWFPLSAIAMVLVGAMHTAYIALNNSLLLEKSSAEYHGRVVSLMSLDRGLVSIGSILAGGLAEALGPQSGLTILAVTCITFTVLMFLLVAPLRKIM